MPEKPPDTRNFVALCPHCGRVVGAIAFNGKSQADDTLIASWVRAGYKVERMTNQEVRDADWMHADNCFSKRPP